jgi:hypothetical protein
MISSKTRVWVWIEINMITTGTMTVTFIKKDGLKSCFSNKPLEFGFSKQTCVVCQGFDLTHNIWRSTHEWPFCGNPKLVVDNGKILQTQDQLWFKQRTSTKTGIMYLASKSKNGRDKYVYLSHRFRVQFCITSLGTCSKFIPCKKLIRHVDLIVPSKTIENQVQVYMFLFFLQNF